MTHPPDPIEQLAAELRELWQDSDLPSSELVAKLIKVAAEVASLHACDECWDCGELLQPKCWADICQRMREGMEP